MKKSVSEKWECGNIVAIREKDGKIGVWITGGENFRFIVRLPKRLGKKHMSGIVAQLAETIQGGAA